jgi:hypothetical protein
MTVLAAVQSSAPWIGIAVPTVLFTGTDRTSVEMQAMVSEAAQGICEDYDWQRIKLLNTITGDGTTTDWPLPSDYARMPKVTSLWPSAQPNSPLTPVDSEDDWLGLEVQSFSSVIGRWIIYANQLHVKPAIVNAATVKHFYISSKIILANGDTAPTKVDFTVDTDSFFLGDRILKLAIIWRWKAAKGRPYEEDLMNYNTLRDQLAGNDRGARGLLRMGGPRMPKGVRVAYPGVLGP